VTSFLGCTFCLPQEARRVTHVCLQHRQSEDHSGLVRHGGGNVFMLALLPTIATHRRSPGLVPCSIDRPPPSHPLSGRGCPCGQPRRSEGPRGEPTPTACGLPSKHSCRPLAGSFRRAIPPTRKRRTSARGPRDGVVLTALQCVSPSPGYLRQRSVGASTDPGHEQVESQDRVDLPNDSPNLILDLLQVIVALIGASS